MVARQRKMTSLLVAARRAAGGGGSPSPHPDTSLSLGVDPPPQGEGVGNDAALRARVWEAAETVSDPEIPVLSVVDLGVLRDVKVENGKIEIFITPTYSGCPAMNLIAMNLECAVEDLGYGLPKVTTVLSPAWTTDWMTEAGKAKLRAYGIAPPQKAAGRRALFGEEQVTCPHCGASDTERLSEFGSTACKALWRCNACREPFDYFKCL